MLPCIPVHADGPACSRRCRWLHASAILPGYTRAVLSISKELSARPHADDPARRALRSPPVGEPRPGDRRVSRATALGQTVATDDRAIVRRARLRRARERLAIDGDEAKLGPITRVPLE